MTAASRITAVLKILVLPLLMLYLHIHALIQSRSSSRPRKTRGADDDGRGSLRGFVAFPDDLSPPTYAPPIFVWERRR